MTRFIDTSFADTMFLELLCFVADLLEAAFKFTLVIVRALSVLAAFISIGAIISLTAGALARIPESQWQEMNDNIFGNQLLGFLVIILSGYGVVLYVRLVEWVHTSPQYRHRRL